MPIQYNSEGHVERITAHSVSEARLIIHELNLKRNEYAATLRRIDEQLAIAQPKAKNATLANMMGALGKTASRKTAARSSTAPWISQLEERKAEFEHHAKTIDDHIAHIHSMIAQHQNAV